MRLLLIIVIVFNCIGYTWGQKDSVQIQIIKDRITARDSIIGQLKSKFKTDSLQLQVEDYSHLVTLIENETKNVQDENASLKTDIQMYKQLLSDDLSVFEKDVISSVKNTGIPVCLQSHFEKISTIVRLKEKIEKTESMAKKLSEQLKDFEKDKVNTLIGEKIETEVSEIDALITEIKQLDLSSLSDIQKKFFLKELIDRYNNFSKYYE